MNLKFALRSIGILAAAALLVTSIGMKPLAAMGTDSPPPSDSGTKKKKKKDNNVIEQQQEQLAQEKFLRDYRAAGCDGFVVNLGHDAPDLDERARRFGAEVTPLL